MAGTSLLALIDDIASILDDVGTLSQTAASKTAGVLGDDLALNAEQVAGVRPERELPVVWAVARGSLINKVILVPLALGLSAFAPVVIAPLLMAGGAYLCFEGFEKLLAFLPSEKKKTSHAPTLALIKSEADLLEFEKEKIKGAIMTDLILSAEIVVIALGTVQGEPLEIQATVLALLALGFTVGVYGLVAAIVKLDDLGLALSRGKGQSAVTYLAPKLGQAILWVAPRFLKSLGLIGTAAMFLVGGGIWAHGIPPLGKFIHGAEHVTAGLPHIGAILGSVLGLLGNAAIGLVVGGLAVAVVHLAHGLFKKVRPQKATG